MFKDSKGKKELRKLEEEKEAGIRKNWGIQVEDGKAEMLLIRQCLGGC